MSQESSCPKCGGYVTGSAHVPNACIEILKWKLEESERERRVAEGTVEWLKKNQISIKRS